jgi:hypothetical protein
MMRMREYNFRVNFKEPFDSARELREFIETLRVYLNEMNMREFEQELESMEDGDCIYIGEDFSINLNVYGEEE